MKTLEDLQSQRESNRREIPTQVSLHVRSVKCPEVCSLQEGTRGRDMWKPYMQRLGIMSLFFLGYKGDGFMLTVRLYARKPEQG